mmetsp:Transcript_140610/g.341622  ORF Transcript_140610/g.341622 Transcript_140610/m.341622 type:complete len:187 (-) Transcript_140610:77-637(-)
MEREPCPYRIVDDIGGAFLMGAVGGGLWHSVKGARNAPAGYRLAGSVQAVKIRAPVLGGNFAVWGGLFSCFDCSFAAIRKKEDPWNAIAAGACTGGVLAARAGPRAMVMNAAIGGALLALIEGVGIWLNKMTAQQMQSAQAAAGIPVDTLAPPVPPPMYTSTFSAESATEETTGVDLDNEKSYSLG